MKTSFTDNKRTYWYTKKTIRKYEFSKLLIYLNFKVNENFTQYNNWLIDIKKCLYSVSWIRWLLLITQRLFWKIIIIIIWIKKHVNKMFIHLIPTKNLNLKKKREVLKRKHYIRYLPISWDEGEPSWCRAVIEGN